jgi:serine O-acetyltransferase
LEDYENNSKAVGYATFSYSKCCKLLVKKRGFRNIYEYRMKQAGFNGICINMFRFFFRPADGIYIHGDIEGGLRVNHDYMVISVEHAGHDFVVQQGVTIASLKRGKKPSFGDDVYIGANALILGECQIGSHVNIGAGAFILNQDIPDNCTVVGNPCRIIPRG